MKEVFAVIFCLLFFCNCTLYNVDKTRSLKANNVEDQSTNVYNDQNILYSIAGDFDEDTYPEYMYLIKTKDDILFLRMMDGIQSFYKELPIKLKNYYADVVDINNDKRDEYILYDTDNNFQNLYIYSFKSNDLNLIFSPDIIQKVIHFNKIKSGYVVTCGKLNRIINSTQNLSLKLYYNDMDFDENGSLFESIGAISSSNNKILYTLSVQYYFDNSNNIKIKNLTILPYSAPMPE